MNKNFSNESTFSVITKVAVFFTLIGLFLYGWVMNIVTIFGMEDVASGEGILRIIGIFLAIIGAVMGYID